MVKNNYTYNGHLLVQQVIFLLFPGHWSVLVKADLGWTEKAV